MRWRGVTLSFEGQNQLYLIWPPVDSGIKELVFSPRMDRKATSALSSPRDPRTREMGAGSGSLDPGAERPGATRGVRPGRG